MERGEDAVIRAAVDPGSAKTSLEITDGDGPLRHVFGETFEVGRLVELSEPRIVQREGYGPVTYTHRRVVTLDDVDAIVAKLIALLTEHSVERLLIEWVEHPFVSADKGGSAAKTARKASSQSEATLWSERIVSALRAEAKRARIEVVLVPSATWRARLRPVLRALAPAGVTPQELTEREDAEPIPNGGSAVRGRGVALKPLLRASIEGWPDDADEHLRDCGGMLVWDVLPPIHRPASTKREPSAAKVSRTRKESRGQAERRAEARAARIAAGCACEKKHRRECPLFKPGRAWGQERLARAVAAARAHGPYLR